MPGGSEPHFAKVEHSSNLLVPGVRGSGVGRGSACGIGSERPEHKTLVYCARQRVRDLLWRAGWYESDTAANIRWLIRGQPFSLVTMVALMIALFLGEIFAVAQVPGNTGLDIILTCVFALFAFEFLGLTMTDASYLFSFFFWMDLLGTCSMAFDISYMAGQNAESPVYVESGSGSASQDNMLVVRAARAAKLGARAGRISRVLKMLRFLPFLFQSQQDDHKAKMAKVISNQLTNVLSTRVAFLTICIVVVMPLFTMFTYPEFDDSMGAWTELLAITAQKCNNTSTLDICKVRLRSEVGRFIKFYADIAYGPFMVEYGDHEGAVFKPRSDILDFSGERYPGTAPRRLSSSRIVSSGNIRTSFDLSAPYAIEAIANIGLICFIILVMVCFGLVMSSSISVIALQPLERMLSVVRDRCKEIFKYTVEMRDDDDEEEDEEDYDDMEHASEFVLLEKVVKKLADIAQVSALKAGPEVKEDMTADEIMELNWMQGGVAVPQANREMRPSGQKRFSAGAELEFVPSVQDSGLSLLLPPSVVEPLNTELFNPLDMDPKTQIAVAVYMVNTMSEGCAEFVRRSVKQSCLEKFVMAAEQGYNPNPFHNFAHALDVQYSLRRWMVMIEADRFLTEVQQFWMLIAGIGHDLGHIGVNNQYLVETSHELAVRYNDRSPLENMHCAKLFQIASDPESNVFSEIEKDLYKDMRKGMIESILHTDITKHNEMVKDMGMLYQLNQEVFDALEPASTISSSSSTTQLIVNMLVHGADVGNPMKPWDLCHRYAHLCLDEFFAQGDLEKDAGIPVQMLNDREKVNRPNSQIGFVEFLIAPMVFGMVNLFPQLEHLAFHLGQNIQKWCETWEREVEPAQEVLQKVTIRVEKVAASMRSVQKLSDPRG